MAEVANKWFIKEEELDKGSRNGPDFLFLKKGSETVKITFLDEDLTNVPILKVFSVFNYKDPSHNFPTHVLAPSEADEESPLMTYYESLEDDTREKKSLKPTAYFCTTVAIQRKSDNGWYPADKMVRFLTKGQMNFLRGKSDKIAEVDEGQMADFDSIHGLTYFLSRSTEDKAAKVGELGEFIAKADLGELLDNPNAFTPDELLSKFETDIEDQQAYVDRMNAGNDTRPVIRR